MTPGNVALLFFNLSWRLVSKAEHNRNSVQVQIQVTKAHDGLHFDCIGNNGDSSINF